jgi:hypothetical protein
VYTRPASLCVTIIGLPTARQPCRTDTDIGASDVIAAATTASRCTAPPPRRNTPFIRHASAAAPPTSGTLAPSRP